MTTVNLDPSKGERPATEVSVVVPVYRGAKTIASLAEEIALYRDESRTPAGRAFFVSELILVWDHGPDNSNVVLRELEAAQDWIRVIWLSRNYGQHAATIAGMAASGGDWIVTMDEDGQHNPADIPSLLDTAYATRTQLVYGAPANRPPHGLLRNVASWLAKTFFLRILSGGALETFHSFRLMAGDAGRAVAAYAGPGVYLDVALSWIISDTATLRVSMRAEGRKAESYAPRALVSHFWRLVISYGNRPLRIVSGLGALSAAGGILLSIWLIIGRLQGGAEVAGWTSTMVALLVIGGLILISLGVIAEYVGLAAAMSMGRPTFVALDDPADRFETQP